jgi:hypothetical protein
MKTSSFFTTALLALATFAHAVPTEINYQGVLTDQNGNPVNGVRGMQIKIYDAPTGGNLTYQENIGNVSVLDGIYSFKFGNSGAGIASILSGNDYLSLVLNGTEQVARTKISSVPFAIKSLESLDAQGLKQTVNTLSSNLTSLRGVVEELQQKSGGSGSISDLGDIALLKGAQSSVGLKIQNLLDTWAEFFTDSNGFYDSFKSSTGFFENYKSSPGFHATPRQSVWDRSQGGYLAVRTVDYFPNSPLRFIRLFTQSQSRSQYSPSFSYSATLEYTDGQIEVIGDSISYGYYTDGQNSTRYKPIGRPNIPVKKISITYTVNYIIADLDFWINKPSLNEVNIPNEFVSNTFKYRAIVDTTEREIGDSLEVSLSGNWGSVKLKQNEWTEIPVSTSYTSNVCAVSISPALSSDWNKASHLRGIILLRQLK